MSTKQPIKPTVFTVLLIVLDVVFVVVLLGWTWVIISTLKQSSTPPKVPASKIQPLDTKGIDAIITIQGQ